uniref:DUF21 domain-containing protein At4g33700 n=1 Tax=Schistocephalus solidus TaxID=70667 RepID=A0A0X3P8D4_SCHSO
MGSSSSVADDSVQSGISTNPSKALLSSEYVKYALCISSYIFLLIFAGIASGLTIGMMSIDPLKLQLIANSGSKSEKKYATFLLPLIKKTHFLLVSLLLANAACVESLPIFLDRVLSPTLAVAISVTSVLVVGEVIPQALFKRYNLKLSYYMLPFTYITLILTSPISYPVSKILNLVLKKERPTLFTRSELHTLIKMHGPLASPEDYDSPSTDISLPLSSSPTPPSSLILSTELDNAHFDASLVGLVQKNTKVSVLRRNGCSSLVEKDKTTSVKSELSEDEVRMISNILGLRDQTCNEIMSPLDNLFVLHTTDIIDKEFLSKVGASYTTSTLI